MKGTVANNKRPRNEKTAGRREKKQNKKTSQHIEGASRARHSWTISIYIDPEGCVRPTGQCSEGQHTDTHTHTKRLREERMGGLVKVASRSVRAASALVTDA